MPSSPPCGGRTPPIAQRLAYQTRTTRPACGASVMLWSLLAVQGAARAVPVVQPQARVVVVLASSMAACNGWDARRRTAARSSACIWRKRDRCDEPLAPSIDLAMASRALARSAPSVCFVVASPTFVLRRRDCLAVNRVKIDVRMPDEIGGCSGVGRVIEGRAQNSHASALLSIA